MFSEPNTFPVPNELVDSAMKNCTTTEICVLLVIIRQTWGFGKTWDYLSISQITKKANISRQGARNAARELEEKGYIQSRYVCHKCLAVLPATYFPKSHGKTDSKSKPPKCPHCATFTPPEKQYALNIKGKRIKEYLSKTLNITATDRGESTQLTGGVHPVDRGESTQLTHNKQSYNKQYTKNKEKEDLVYIRDHLNKEPNLKTDESAQGLFSFDSLEEKQDFEDLRELGITPIKTAKAIIENNRDNEGLVHKGIYRYLETDRLGPGYLIGVLRKLGVRC